MNSRLIRRVTGVSVFGQPTRHTIVALVVSMIVSVIGGCSNEKPVEESHRQMWLEGGGEHVVPVHRNFYFSDRQKYPGYGIVQYDVDDGTYTEANERRYVLDALHQCRADFGWAYRKNLITDIGDRNEPIYVPLEYVAVVIFDRSAIQNGEKDVDAAHRAGYVFPAAELFGEPFDGERLLADAKRDANPYHFDTEGIGPGRQAINQGERTHFLVIERHREEHKADQAGTDRESQGTP